VDGAGWDCSGAADQFAFYANGLSLCSGVTATLNTWYHVAVSRDSAGTVRLFVNGVLRATRTAAPAVVDSNGVLTAGRAGNYTGEYFNGLVDEVRVSTAAVYTADFTPPTTRLPATASTYGLWHFDEGSGQVLTDVSGNGRNGTLGTSSAADSADPVWSTDTPVAAN
jgi:hypothetical protein